MQQQYYYSNLIYFLPPSRTYTGHKVYSLPLLLIKHGYLERNVVSLFVFIVLRAIPFRDIRNVERRRRIDDILDTNIFKVSKVTTRGRELEGEWYVLLRACIFVLLPLDWFSSSLGEIWSPKLTGHHQRYALALKGKLRYCYSSLSCGLCLLGQMLRSKNQHRGPTAGFETRLTRDFSSISTLLAFRYPYLWTKISTESSRVKNAAGFDRKRLR